jgi:phospholipase/carboxylesterase
MKTFETLILSPRLPAKNTVIWLHGLGADGHDFLDIVPELHLPDTLAVRFIFPHAPIRPVSLNNGLPMRAWFDIHGLTGDARIDEQGIHESDAALRALIKQEIEQGIPAENIVLAGFSQGGVLALYSGLTYPKRLGGILGLSTFFPIHVLREIHQPKDIPIFIAHGDYDTVLLPTLGHASSEALLTQGFQPEWRTYPMAHSVCHAEIHDISAWLIKQFTKPLLPLPAPQKNGEAKKQKKHKKI